MKSRFDGQGYFFNDDRCSGGKFEEDDIVGCKHCQKALKKSKWKEEGGWCAVCDAVVCINCLGRIAKFGCEVYERRITQAVNNHYRREQNRKLFG